MKAYGSGCIDPHFLDLGTSWRWVVNFTLRPLYPRGKSPRYPLDRKLGGPQSRSGRFGEEKILDPTWTGTPTPSVVQPVASRYTDYAIPAPKWITLTAIMFTFGTATFIYSYSDKNVKDNIVNRNLKRKKCLFYKYISIKSVGSTHTDFHTA
jgi:hypothetical protein